MPYLSRMYRTTGVKTQWRNHANYTATKVQTQGREKFALSCIRVETGGLCILSVDQKSFDQSGRLHGYTTRNRRDERLTDYCSAPDEREAIRCLHHWSGVTGGNLEPHFKPVFKWKAMHLQARSKFLTLLRVWLRTRFGFVVTFSF